MTRHQTKSEFDHQVAWARKRLESHGLKLAYSARRGGFAILEYSEAGDFWMEFDGLSPVPYSLSLDDVMEWINELTSEAAQHSRSAPELRLVT